MNLVKWPKVRDKVKQRRHSTRMPAFSSEHTDRALRFLVKSTVQLFDHLQPLKFAYWVGHIQ